MTIDYDSELNPAQREAVLHGPGPVLVIAGAGSGKTRTLVYRVARLVEESVSPESIMLLTFTRRASEEMLVRAARLLDARCGHVDGGTFHSVANRLLRMYGERVGLPAHFTILDRADAEEIISWVRKEKGLHHKELGFPKKGTLANVFSRSVNTGKAVPELIVERYAHLEPFAGDMLAVWEGYVVHKRRNNLLDYDDLLVFLKVLLQEDEGTRAIISRRYRHILVDEFQDTNHLQADIVEWMTGPERNIMAVGDDSQSIYSFRGARYLNIIEFPGRFPGTDVIKLEQNYRSTQPVLRVANHVIAQASTPYTKCLFTTRKGGVEPVVSAAEDEHTQSLMVVRDIANLMERGVRLAEMAVLFRSSYHSFDLEVELGNRAYSFVKYGGFKFLELAHVKDVMAHLRVLSNPQDRLSWHRVLMLLPGVGMTRARKILDYVLGADSSLERLQSCPDTAKVPQLSDLAGLLNRLREVRGDPAKRLEMILDYYDPLLKSLHDDYPRRRRHLDQLLALASRFTRTQEFLAEVTLEPPQEERKGSGRRDDVLTLSTIHSAKGLEWKAVFIVWAAEGWFPSGLSMDDGEDLEEERRLMYVAVTRAEDHLFIHYPKTAFKRGEGRVWTRPSRFIQDLATEPRRNREPFRKGSSDLLLDLTLKYGGSLTGRKVHHATFGPGVVVAHQGMDTVMVQFETKGLLSLNLKYAPLEILEK